MLHCIRGAAGSIQPFVAGAATYQPGLPCAEPSPPLPAEQQGLACPAIARYFEDILFRRLPALTSLLAAALVTQRHPSSCRSHRGHTRRSSLAACLLTVKVLCKSKSHIHTVLLKQLSVGFVLTLETKSPFPARSSALLPSREKHGKFLCSNSQDGHLSPNTSKQWYVISNHACVPCVLRPVCMCAKA